MTRFVAFPLAASMLLLIWLLLNQSLSWGHLLLGSIGAVVGSATLMALGVSKARTGRPMAVLRLAALVVADIVRSNVAVGRIVLGVAGRERRSGFVEIPLELRSPYGLATLAVIITSTPGTLWVSLDRATGVLLIHVLDLVSEADWHGTIKGRYERLLLEIFE